MHLFDMFDRICIINLPEREDRRRQVVKELDKLGYRVDGQRIRFVPGQKVAQAAPFPSAGAHGCYLSHLAVLRQALEDGLHSVLVLEDDVCFSRLLAHPHAPLAKALAAPDWGIAYPGHAEAPTPGLPHWQLTTTPLVCAHCYGVQQPTLGPLVEYLTSCLQRPPGHPDGGPMHVDGAISMFRQRTPDCTTWMCQPSLAHQRSSRSDIAGTRWFDRGWLRPGTSLLRALRNALRNHRNA